MTRSGNGDGSPVALVTGGSRGIGAAIVRRLRSDGYRVYFNYLSDHEAAEAVAANAGAVALQRDVRSRAEVVELLAEIEKREGRLDACVHNAASGVFRPFSELSDRHWRWTFETNARPFLWLAQLAVPLMERAGAGRIVALTSPGARMAIPGYTLVGASKAALESLVRHLALELAGRRIAVNAVCPGLVRTAGIEAFLDPAWVERTEERTPAGRLVGAEDVAGVVAFLCGPESEMIHGQVLVVDGGYGIVA